MPGISSCYVMQPWWISYPLVLRYWTISFSTTACCRCVGPFMAGKGRHMHHSMPLHDVR